MTQSSESLPRKPAFSPGGGDGARISLPPPDLKPRPIFRGGLAAVELSRVLNSRDGPIEMLDVGGGHGIHSDWFRHSVPGVKVDLLDLAETVEPLVFEGDVLQFETSKRYDVVWTSHVMEHQRNVGLFLDKLHSLLKPGGLLCVTVPPHVGGLGIVAHLTTWDPMLLIINLVQGDFDCRSGRFARYQYNVSGIVERPRQQLPTKQLLPPLDRVGHRLSGQFKFLNWETKSIEPDPEMTFASVDACLAYCNSIDEPKGRFCQVEIDGAKQIMYIDERDGWLLQVN